MRNHATSCIDDIFDCNISILYYVYMANGKVAELKPINSFFKALVFTSKTDRRESDAASFALESFYTLPMEGINRLDYAVGELGAIGIVFPLSRPFAMSTVIMDRSIVNSLLGQDGSKRGELLENVTDLLHRVHSCEIGSNVDQKVWQIARDLDPALKRVLESSMVLSDSVGFVDNDGVELQVMPLDFIASIQALYCALSDEKDSSTIRQGAITTSCNNWDLVVSTTGLNGGDNASVSGAVGNAAIINFLTGRDAQQSLNHSSPPPLTVSG